MKTTSKKRGFTIVELVIVIAVIAILAAVLIPTFTSVVGKSRESSDESAIRNMNTILAAEGVATPPDIFSLHDVLGENGISSKNYSPLYKDRYFFWDADLNRVLYVDKDYKIIAPADYAGQQYVAGTSNWYSLSLDIPEEKVAITDNKVTVTNGAQMNYVLGKLEKGTKTLEITIDGTIDMMGAIFDFPTLAEDAGYNVTIKGGAIKNATAIDNAQGAISGKSGYDGIYNCALIPSVKKGNTVTISNVVFENINVKNTNVGNVGLLIGDLIGTATIENVTIKNSTVIGHRNTGALVGYMGSEHNGHGNLTLKGNIKLENVSVETVGGRSAMLVGFKATNPTITANEATIAFTGSSYSVYNCEQNTGTYNGTALGLSNGTLTSYVTRVENNEAVNALEVKTFIEKALVMTGSETALTSEFYGATVTGWN